MIANRSQRGKSTPHAIAVFVSVGLVLHRLEKCVKLLTDHSAAVGALVYEVSEVSNRVAKMLDQDAIMAIPLKQNCDEFESEIETLPEVVDLGPKALDLRNRILALAGLTPDSAESSRDEIHGSTLSKVVAS